MGFVTKANLGVNHAITDCDFKLYQHGEEHNPPSDYGFTFWAGKISLWPKNVTSCSGHCILSIHFES